MSMKANGFDYNEPEEARSYFRRNRFRMGSENSARSGSDLAARPHEEKEERLVHYRHAYIHVECGSSDPEAGADGGTSETCMTQWRNSWSSFVVTAIPASQADTVSGRQKQNMRRGIVLP